MIKRNEIVFVMQRLDRKTRKWNKLFIVASVFLSILITGCSSVRMTMTQRSILEQQLIVRGLERAVSQIHIEQFTGKRVALEMAGLVKDDLPFAKEFVHVWLAKHGVQVVQDQKEIDLRLKVFARVLAVDQSEILLGTPEFIFLGLPVPALVIYRNVRNRGRVELQMYALDERSETLVDELPVGIGEAKYHRYTILLFFSWSSTDLNKKPEGMEK